MSTTDATVALAEAARIADRLGEGDRAAGSRVRAQGLMAEARAEVFLAKLGLG